MVQYLEQAKNQRFIAFLAVGFCLLLCVEMGLLVPVLSGLFSYQLIFYMAKRFLPTDFETHTAAHHHVARTIAGAIMACMLILAVTLAVVGIQYFFKDGDTVRALILKISEIIDSARASLPATFAQHLPEQDSLFKNAGAWVKMHAGALSSAGLTTITSIGMSLLGMLLGGMISISQATRTTQHGPIASALLVQVSELRFFFTHVASAQVKISAINTACTAFYLYVILPMFGVDIGMKGALVTTTFIAGLLPVVGNLIANTAMTIISLDYSVGVAVCSLSYLMVIHKFEYIWSGKIIGRKVNASVWEILVAMIFMEHALGLAGLVIAPIFYAWLKSEWNRWDLQPNVEKSQHIKV